VSVEQDIQDEASRRRERIAELSPFDGNLWIGGPSFFPLARELHPGAVAGTMREYGLQGALLSHWDSIRLSAQEGNQALLEAGGELPESAYTVWTGLPTAAPEQDPLPGRGRPEARLRGVRLFPKTHQYQLASWTMGPLCEWCIEHRVALFLWHVELEWGDLQSLAACFPRLQIVVESQWQKILYHNRDLFSLLQACPNLLLESSNFIGQDNVSVFVRCFGAERLLWGSFLPVNDPYASIGMVLDADITEGEKKLIAGGNLRRLIAEVRA
jgi:hypothetical protein